MPVPNTGLFARLGGFYKHIARDSGEFGVIRSLNKKNWNVCQGVKVRGQRRLFAKWKIEQIETELRRTDHEREPGEASAFHANLHHLRRSVVHRVEDQCANARISLGLPKRRISAEVVAPHAEVMGIHVVARGQGIESGA